MSSCSVPAAVLTYILVDFENVQPSAADIGLLRGDGLRLAIFRGPGQLKYSADVAESWQPMGANLTFIRCAKAGRNAVDMHIAFYLGELVAAAAGGKGSRFVIVSRDTDFDPLLLHIRGQGFEASRVASIKAALGGSGADKAEPRAAKTRTRSAPAAKTERVAKAAKSATQAPAAKKSATKRAAAKTTVPAPAPAAKKASRPARASASHSVEQDGVTKVIESLQRMGDRRPAKRAGLERHIESHLGRNMEPGVLQTLLQQLERDGVLVFNDNKVEYRLAKARR